MEDAQKLPVSSNGMGHGLSCCSIPMATRVYHSRGYPGLPLPWLPEFTITMTARVCLQTVHLLSRLAGKIPADGYVSMLGISQGISVSLKVSVLVISRYRLAVVSTNFLCSSFNFFFARKRSWFPGMATASESSTFMPDTFSVRLEKKRLHCWVMKPGDPE